MYMYWCATDVDVVSIDVVHWSIQQVYSSDIIWEREGGRGRGRDTGEGERYKGEGGRGGREGGRRERMEERK